jgi:hypothetical protein
MSPQTMEAALNFMVKIADETSQRKFKITFHGGEPLQAGHDLWRQALLGLDRRLGRGRYEVAMQSNLWLLDDQFCQLFAEHKVEIGTSLDGPEEITDHQRGPGYFAKTLQGVRMANCYGMNVGCIATFTPYTRTLHYSTPYAVGAERVGEIIERFSARTAESFDWADYGFRLDSEDQRRRYVLLGLLEHEGLDATAYAARFASDPWIDIPQLGALAQHGLMDVASDRLRLTEFGLERSDAIGPWLYSHKVRQLTEAYPLC